MQDQTKYDVVIIGAGPAGLMTAIQCHAHKKVLVIEKNFAAGRKLLIAGSGRCNITHTGTVSELLEHYGNASRFLRTALNEFSNRDLIDFLQLHRMNIMVDKNGKVFPESEQSKDVLNLLLHLCHQNGVEIMYNSNITKIDYNTDFYIVVNNKTIQAVNLVLATGGKSYPATGSAGDGYEYAKLLQHTITEPKPALTPLLFSDFAFKDISGVAVYDVDLELYRNNKKIATHTGDVGITHQGLSGPGILDFSRYFEIGDTLKINFAKTHRDIFEQHFIEKSRTGGKTILKNYLKEYKLPESLIVKILEINNIDTQLSIAVADKKTRQKVTELFTAYPFVIEKTGDFKVAMVTAGGVSTAEINQKTMESKKIKNLFFAGEIIDMDGDTGGYNIQAAFSTAYLAAKAINLARSEE